MAHMMSVEELMEVLSHYAPDDMVVVDGGEGECGAWASLYVAPYDPAKAEEDECYDLDFYMFGQGDAVLEYEE